MDKRSFIRAKQSQIHVERQQRKLQIEAYKHQRIVNDGLAQRLSLLISALHSQNTASIRDTNVSPSEMAFKAIMELALRNPEEDTPPPLPEGVSDADSSPLPRYSKMAAAILDEANKALDQRHIEDRNLRFEALAGELEVHVRNIQLAQTELIKKLDELEQQGSKKITSDSYHVGFNTSHVSKSEVELAVQSAAGSSSSDTKVELLNPKLPLHEGVLDAEEDAPRRASSAAKRFAQIQTSDYRASQEFLASHPEILHEQETDGLLFEAYTLLLDQGDQAHTHARQCTHQALLLQYCRSLGRDGVAMFFKRVATPGHQARDIFEKDLADTFQKIQGMAKRDAKKRQQGAETGQLVERVQLCSLTDGEGSVRILVPPAGSENEEGQKARAIFESFAPEMRAALETGSLDEVNKVLGGMDVAEAENLVSLLTEVSFPSLVHAPRPTSC